MRMRQRPRNWGLRVLALLTARAFEAFKTAQNQALFPETVNVTVPTTVPPPLARATVGIFPAHRPAGCGRAQPPQRGRRSAHALKGRRKL